MAVAAEVEHVSVSEAFAVCLVLARAGDLRFERAARRLVERAVAERGIALADMALLTTALALLGDPARCGPAAERTAALLEQFGFRGAQREAAEWATGPRPP